MKPKKTEFELDEYYIVHNQFKMLGEHIPEFQDKVKKHKFWIPPWWANKEIKKEPDALIPYWNTLFGTPHLLEQEFIQELIDEYGVEKAKLIIRQFREDNFHVVKTMREALNKDGTIKKRVTEPTGRVIKDDEFRPVLEEAYKKSKGQPKIEKGWITNDT